MGVKLSMSSPDRKTARVSVVFERDLPEDSGLNRLRRRVIKEQGGVIIPQSLIRPFDQRTDLPRLSHVPDHSRAPKLVFSEPVTDQNLRRVQENVARKQRLKGHR